MENSTAPLNDPQGEPQHNLDRVRPWEIIPSAKPPEPSNFKTALLDRVRKVLNWARQDWAKARPHMTGLIGTFCGKAAFGAGVLVLLGTAHHYSHQAPPQMGAVEPAAPVHSTSRHKSSRKHSARTHVTKHAKKSHKTQATSHKKSSKKAKKKSHSNSNN